MVPDWGIVLIYIAQLFVWTEYKYIGISQQGTLQGFKSFVDPGLPFLTHAKR